MIEQVVKYSLVHLEDGSNPAVVPFTLWIQAGIMLHYSYPLSGPGQRGKWEKMAQVNLKQLLQYIYIQRRRNLYEPQRRQEVPWLINFLKIKVLSLQAFSKHSMFSNLILADSLNLNT